MRGLAVQACPADVIGYPGRLYVVDQGFKLCEIMQIRRFVAADVKRQPVQHYRVVCTDFMQDGAGTPARRQIVLCDQFKPVYRRLMLQHIVIVLTAQSQPESEHAHT
jgi:hypothetical protein